MLDLKRVIKSKPREHEMKPLNRLTTPWGESLDPEQVLDKHPRPQFARESIRILNGYWDCTFVPCSNAPKAWENAPCPADNSFDMRILVPFSPEAPLSEVERQLQPDELLWYRLQLDAPQLSEDMRCLLHFDAVDYACACYVNGMQVGTHRGGYTAFTFDITDALSAAATPQQCEIMLCVHDPSGQGVQLRGKQKLKRSDIWYTAQSGIWQTVWLEFVPTDHLKSVHVATDIDAQTVTFTPHVAPQADTTKAVANELVIDVFEADASAPCASATVAPSSAKGSATGGAAATAPVRMAIPTPHVWTPDDPYLYRVEYRYGTDQVTSYFAFRSAQVAADGNGTMRFFLNGEPLLLRGVLDQGYWPDGLMTAPSDEALVHDIKTMCNLGFNMMRKHVKIESERWYYHCDRLGMLVWQDMVSGGGEHDDWFTLNFPTLLRPTWRAFRDDNERAYRRFAADSPTYRAEWLKTCHTTIRQLQEHPSIVAWVLFNESWGQFDSRAMTEYARMLDPTRPIDATSGWYDQGCGDFQSVHNYFRDLRVYPDMVKGRAFVLSEFGGLTWHVDGHSVLDESYGYADYTTPREWADAVRAHLATAEALSEKGLAGYVFTQLSDIEEESNGLLTYDRRINKLRDLGGLDAVGEPGEAGEPDDIGDRSGASRKEGSDEQQDS